MSNKPLDMGSINITERREIGPGTDTPMLNVMGTVIKIKKKRVLEAGEYIINSDGDLRRVG